MLEERLRLQRLQKYGPGSYKLSEAQLDLLELEPGVSHLEVQCRERTRARSLVQLAQVARYKGTGSIDDTANFACVELQ